MGGAVDMIERTIDLWDAGAVADAVVITTNGTVKRNGQGVMGRGCAWEAAQRWRWLPLALGTSITTIGNHCVLFQRAVNGRAMVVSFPVKHAWHEKADLVLIEQSADELQALAEMFNWTMVVLPRPGCGNGQRTWDEVRPVIAPYLDNRFVVVTK